MRVIFLGLLFTALGLSAPITVQNASFETASGYSSCAFIGAGCQFTVAAPNGWGATGSSLTFGVLDPGTTTNLLNSVPDGVNVAYHNGGTLFQTVTPTALPGLTYTLLVDVGLRKDFPHVGIVELLIGSTVITATGTNPTSGDWSTFQAQYTASLADLGEAITIRLRSTAAQAVFDNVRLDATEASDPAIPEPSTMALVGLGALGMVAWARRKPSA
jgi:hypothetical protein